MVRPAESALPSVGRSATVRWLHGPCCRSCRARRSSCTSAASFLRCSARTARPRWGRSARPSLSLMDAGVPIEAPVAGIADGPRLRRRSVHHAHGHPRRRGRVRRHGLQGPRHGRQPSCAATDTKIDGIPADVLTAALQQAKVARLEILEVMNAAISAPRTSCGDCAEDHHADHPNRQGRRGDRPQGQGHQHDQSETGADIGVDDDGAQGIVTIGAVESWRMEEAKAAIRRSSIRPRPS